MLPLSQTRQIAPPGLTNPTAATIAQGMVINGNASPWILHVCVHPKPHEAERPLCSAFITVYNETNANNAAILL